MTTQHGTTIDILPFGSIEVDDGVIIDGTGLSSIRVNGFKEVSEKGVSEVNIEDNTYYIATLPAIVLLKLIAYDDRPEHRPNDPGDIATILQNYFDIETDIFYDFHTDLLERIDEGRDLIAARAIGRSIQKIVSSNIPLRNKVQGILLAHILQSVKSNFVVRMTKVMDGTIERSSSLLQEIVDGLNA